MARFSILAFFFAALVAAQVHAQTEPVVVKRPTELRKASSERSTSLATLAAQMPVNRQPSRRGAWAPVRTASGATSTSSAPSNTATGALRGACAIWTDWPANPPSRLRSGWQERETAEKS